MAIKIPKTIFTIKFGTKAQIIALLIKVKPQIIITINAILPNFEI